MAPMMERSMTEVLKRVVSLETDRDTLMTWRRSIVENTSATKDNTQMMEDLATALKAMSWFIQTFKWLAMTGAACGAIFAAWKGIK